MVLQLLTSTERNNLTKIYTAIRSSLDQQLGQGVRYRGLVLQGSDIAVSRIRVRYEVPVQDPDGDTVWVLGATDILPSLSSAQRARVNGVWTKVLGAVREQYGPEAYLEGVEVVQAPDGGVWGLKVTVNYEVGAPGVGSTRARKVVEVV